MSSSAPAPSTITFTIRQPERLLGWVWISLGASLMICFLLPNFGIGTLDIHGPKLLDMLLRRDGNPERMFDEAGFYMMIAVPIVYAAMALVLMGLGLHCLIHRDGRHAMLAATLGLFVLIFAIVGAIVIADSGSKMLIFAKLMPKPKMGYWIAVVAEGLQSVLSVAYLIFKGSLPTTVAKS